MKYISQIAQTKRATKRWWYILKGFNQKLISKAVSFSKDSEDLNNIINTINLKYTLEAFVQKSLQIEHLQNQWNKL